MLSEKEESSTMIRVITYGDTINSKMEEEDTKYVIDELKKSQESLQNRYKVGIDYLPLLTLLIKFRGNLFNTTRSVVFRGSIL